MASVGEGIEDLEPADRIIPLLSGHPSIATLLDAIAAALGYDDFNDLVARGNLYGISDFFNAIASHEGMSLADLREESRALDESQAGAGSPTCALAWTMDSLKIAISAREVCPPAMALEVLGTELPPESDALGPLILSVIRGEFRLR